MTNPSKKSPPFWDAERFREAIYGASVADLARWSGCDPATCRRWQTGSLAPGAATQRLVQLHAAGKVIPDTPGWASTRFDRDRLITSSGDSYAPGELAALLWYRTGFDALAARLQRIEHSGPEG